MSISFMVLGGPRSATTWAANWLTTDSTLCLHDPLLEYRISELEQMQFPGKRLGISCTASLLFPEWIETLTCPKIILYRDIEEINNSLRQLGLVQLDSLKHFSRVANVQVDAIFPYEHIFAPTGAKIIAEILGVPFDPARHDLLRQMRVEPMWKHLNVGREAAEALVKRIVEAR